MSATALASSLPAHRSWRSAAVLLTLVTLGCVLTGCPSAGVYRTARNINEREIDIGLLVSATHVNLQETTLTDPQTGQTTTEPAFSATFISWAPEVSLHYGITDDVEFGGRVALSSIMGELDVKLRLVGNRDAATHLAIAPAVGYQTLLFIEGPHATLPLIFTHSFRSDIAVNLAAYGSYRNLHFVDVDSDNDINRFAANFFGLGGSVGLEFRGRNMALMPVLDVSRTVTSLGSSSTNQYSGTQTFVIFGLAFSAIGNRQPAPLPPPPPQPLPPPAGYAPM